ncbi:MAG: hypothetical protein M3P11_00615 [Actinomycetota bacterium]|nr:hypothetical protein [Actinomycetota bacterium]
MKSRHDRKRRIERGVLAVAVLAGFGLVVFALSRASIGTGPATKSPNPSVAAVANGKIVFVRPHRFGSELWTIDPDGQERQLTFGGWLDSSPSVSPDGTLIVFSRQTPANQYGGSRGGLLTIPIGGGTPPTSILSVSPFPTDGGFISVDDPAWSPDGRWIVFAGGGPSIATGIYVTPADGSGTPRLIYAGKTDLAEEGHPSWSPDGREIVFQEGNAALGIPTNFNLYVVAVDGSTPALDITPDTHCAETEAAWSPDGTWIAFSQQAAWGTRSLASCRAKPGALLAVSPDGTDWRYVTHGSADVDPTWSPDGTTIAFARRSADGTSLIETVSGVGDPSASITMIAQGEDPTWQPVFGVSATHSHAPSESPSPAFRVTETVPGVSQPVCHVTSTTGDFFGDGVPDTAYVFVRKEDVTKCPDPGPIQLPTKIYIAVQPDSKGDVDLTYGPIGCQSGCQAFAALDADQLDSSNEAWIGVTTTEGAANDFVSLYRVVNPAAAGGSGPTLEEIQVESKDGTTSPMTLDWGGSVMNQVGAYCSPSDVGPLLIVWSTSLIGTGDPPKYHVDEVSYEVEGGRLVRPHHFSVNVSEGQLPEGGGGTICGTPVAP